MSRVRYRSRKTGRGEGRKKTGRIRKTSNRKKTKRKKEKEMECEKGDDEGKQEHYILTLHVHECTQNEGRWSEKDLAHSSRCSSHALLNRLSNTEKCMMWFIPGNVGDAMCEG